jgi:hypothetical protein
MRLIRHPLGQPKLVHQRRRAPISSVTENQQYIRNKVMVKNLTILVFAVLNQMGLRSKTKRNGRVEEATCSRIKLSHYLNNIFFLWLVLRMQDSTLKTTYLCTPQVLTLRVTLCQLFLRYIVETAMSLIHHIWGIQPQYSCTKFWRFILNCGGNNHKFMYLMLEVHNGYTPKR